ncbi:hypothetical protein [Mycobacterium sp. NPDC050441]|uniref:hypothetical protein n=1 Tax=Mycobacterium sp. NPDC050441 TaxID=3155403 RepID=UPI0033E9374B
MTGPFGGQPPEFGSGFGAYPPLTHGQTESAPRQTHGAGSPLAVISVFFGVGALLLAFVPYYVGLIAAVAGIAGLTVGIVALVRRGTDGPSLAAIGTVTSALALIMGIVMTIVYSGSGDAVETPAVQTAAPSAGRPNTQKVLADELEVTIGDFVMSTEKTGELSVSVRNRLKEARTFYVLIGAFEGNAQLASSSIEETLNAGQTKKATAFDGSGQPVDYIRIKNATFRVIEAGSREPN